MAPDRRRHARGSIDFFVKRRGRVVEAPVCVSTSPYLPFLFFVPSTLLIKSMMDAAAKRIDSHESADTKKAAAAC